MPAKGHLLRVLGVGFGVAVSVGGTVGAGILRAPGMVAEQLPSIPLIIAIWIVGALYAFVCTISVSELATSVPREGGWYVFSRRAFGVYGGFFAGYADLLVQFVALAYVCAAAGEFAVALFPGIGLSDKAIAIAIVIILGLLHSLGIRMGSRVQELNSVIVGVGLIGFVIACFLLGGHASAQSPPSPVPALPAGASLLVAFVIAFQAVIITFDGWYCAIYFMEEDCDPSHNLPRSALTGVACCAAIFLLVNFAVMYVLPLPQLAASKAPAADVAQIIFGPVGHKIVLLISLTAFLGVANSIFLMSPRILFAMGRDGWFSSRAADVNKGGTPVVGLVLAVVVAIALILGRSFEKLITIESINVVVLYITGFISLFVLRKREPDLPRPFKAWAYPWTPLAALLGSFVYLALNVASDFKNVMLGLIFVACSYPVYLIAKHFRTEPLHEVEAEVLPEEIKTA
jgi:basic amino acid/polyamine antiporter, APA family